MSSHAIQNCVIALGDVHAPYHSRKKLDEAIYLVQQAKPKVCVQMGDLFDLFSFNRFRIVPLKTASDEIREARETGLEMWRRIREKTPGTQCVQLVGNHDARALARAYDLDPRMGALLEELGISRFWDFEGVKTYHDEREEVIIDGNLYTHGFTKFGAHAPWFQRNTVCGHLHRGAVQYHKLFQNKHVWELNVGYLGDPTSVPLSYTKTKHQHWTWGVGWIDPWGPRFIQL